MWGRLRNRTRPSTSGIGPGLQISLRHFLERESREAVGCSDRPTERRTGELTETVRRDLRTQQVDIVDSTPGRTGPSLVSSILVAV